MKRLIVVIAAAIFAVSCQSEPEFTTTEGGIKFRLLVDEPGQEVQANELMLMKMSQFVNDSLLFSTPSKVGDVLNPSRDNVPEELRYVLQQCSIGDSVELQMTAKQYVEMVGGFYPDGVDSLDVISWRIKVDDIGPELELFERYKAKAEELSAGQLEADIESLKAYAVNNNLDYQQTEEGLLFVVLQEGNGEFPQLGQNVSVNYTVKMMDGTFVDTSYEEVAKENNAYSEQRPGGYAPISFQLGGQGIIPGWNIGIPKFSKGGKGIMLIPSKFAYGERGRGQIGPDTNLIFDIEVVDFQ